ncbi:hypothetical protein [Rhizobium alvei]|uniref:Transmembrane protein n=1 Tax=Rhizobium alvei TaxID=1132659 RepID=A0ABT8YQ76_9HYPH|nr:hypothetical protein [Rhizobium alvei]MDO6965513.1 hypothetical protein [Rhizobium alvei]
MMKIEAESGESAGGLISWLPKTDGTAGLTARLFWRYVLLFSLAAALWQVVAHFVSFKDYLGPDPDDSMRLVEIRDFLNGQGWFDLMQYRLGPEGGTLMHWSRFIDLPIAALILFFQLFTSDALLAEKLAVGVWPVLLILPLMAAMGLACFRLGGRHGLLIGLALLLMMLAAIVRFRPGAIDHHNVQLILVVAIAAFLIDPLARFSNFFAAGVASALAMAIGAETTPFVAVAALSVALLWGIQGERYRNAAIGFGLAFYVSALLAFVGIVPATLYSQVTCDTLSIGYLSLVVAGGFLLAIASMYVSRASLVVRFASLAVIGVLVAVIAVKLAPECLRSPLDSLDPLLVAFWLDGITEAQSIVREAINKPATLGGFYAVGLLAMVTCLYRILKAENRLAYSVLFALIGVSWLVAAVQIRGSLFSNVLAFLPLSALIAGLRARYIADRANSRAALAFVFAVLASLPSVWTFSGALASKAFGSASEEAAADNASETDRQTCPSKSALQAMATLPPGRILSSSNPGSLILRYTPHSALTGNYHRNQSGMVAALKMEMAAPDEALTMIRKFKIDYVLLCDGDGQVKALREHFPGGLVGRIFAGEVPVWLEAIDLGNDPKIKSFRVTLPQ